MVTVRSLTKVFNPNIKAVDEISFNLERGEIFGFLGPNGAGKSTTIKVLTTLLKKTSGKVIIDGIDLDRDPAAIRRTIGYASQEIGIDDDLTGRENLRLQCKLYHLPAGQIDSRVDELLRTMDLMEAADRHAGTYSGGMKKRLDLAAALIHKPKLLFLDEPTTGLDPQNRRAVWEYIKSLNESGTTIFLTTQYLEEADQLADRLSIIDHGKIVAGGTPAALKAEIGADVVELILKEDGLTGVRTKTKEVLGAIVGIKKVQEYDGSVAAYCESGSTLVPQIVRALDRAGIEIAHLTLSGPSLDDVFLKHTGRKMRVEEVKPRSSVGGWGRRR